MGTTELISENAQEKKDFSLTKIRPKVLFFDVNETLLDLSQVKAQVAEALEGRDDLLALWFTTMLQYSLVMTTRGQYDHC